MTANSPVAGASPRAVGVWLLGIATLLALIDSIFNYFWTDNGIHGTPGALLVIVSAALQLIATLLIYFRVVRGGWMVLFEVLIFLDLIGTGLAANLLEAWILLALTVIAFIGWLLQLIRQPAQATTPGVNP
jgi:quinoprotein glucose dehydrogenase